MVFRVSGKNIEVGEALQRRVSARIQDATAKYFDGGFSGHATVGKDGFQFHTECVVHLDTGITLEAEGMSADAYDSADLAATNIEKRLRRYKRKRTDYRDGREKRAVK
jgi:ribosomal subunit interface protein